MTISSTSRRAGPYLGNGVSTSFPFAFKVFARSDVLVTLTDVAGVESTLVLDSLYTVSLNADQNANPGGTVTYLALTSGEKLTLTGAVNELQPTALTNAGGFYPRVIEDSLDRGVVLIQQLREQVNRSFKFPVSDTVDSSTIPTVAVRANKLLGFDSSGNAVAIAPASGSAADVALSLATPAGTSLVGFMHSGAGAVYRTAQGRLRDFVDARDFGAVAGGDVAAAINLALAAGPKRIRAVGEYEVASQILVSGKTGVVLDLSDADLTAVSALDVSLIRLINSTRCVVLPSVIDGNASAQTSSSFGIDLNGGSHNKVIGGRVTNCKTYGVYNIGCNYALIEGVEADNCQQAGIAGDVGGGSVTGFRVRNVIVHDNGLSGTGATSGLYLEGVPGSGLWFTDLAIDGVVAYGNWGAGVAGQGWQFYSLSNVKASGNYQQGIALFACLYGNGGNFILNGNDVGATPGYDSGLAIDDAAVTPASQYNSFTGIFSANHSGYAVLERGTANNNTFLAVDSVSDGGVFALAGAASIGLRRNVLVGGWSFAGQMTGNSAFSGIGYSTGAGGTATQATSKSTGVTLNRPVGRITMNNASLAANTTTSFTLTNSTISSDDHLILGVQSGGMPGAYKLNFRCANGSAEIEVTNTTAGALAEGITITFAVIKGAGT